MRILIASTDFAKILESSVIPVDIVVRLPPSAEFRDFGKCSSVKKDALEFANKFTNDD